MLNNHLRDYQTDENNNPKSKECLLVKPSRELNFLHLKNKYVADLNLFNRKDESVLYKVRTTAAKSYVVVPNIGVIPPNGSVTIKVYMPKSEQVRDRMSDKFLVQAFIYKGNHLYDDVVVLNQTFDHYYKTLTSKDVQNTKLKVYFDSHTVIEEEISEDGTPATRNYSPFKTPKLENNLDSSMKNLRESYLSSSANAQQPSQVLMAMSPEPDSSTMRGAKNDYNNLSKILPDDSLRASVNMSDAGSYRHTEAEPRRFSGVLEKPREQDVFAASYRDMDNMSVARSLREELEKENKKASLANITNSYRREPNSNDVSIHTEFSDVRSDISVTEQLTAYKRRLQKLEDKFNEQHALINQLTQEKERYKNEAQNVRRGSASLSTTADESKLDNQPRRLDVWHIMILCVVCMILGSLFR